MKKIYVRLPPLRVHLQQPRKRLFVRREFIIGELGEYRTQVAGDYDTQRRHASSFVPFNHPKHYTSHPSGVECITISEHYNFCIGNCIKCSAAREKMEKDLGKVREVIGKKQFDEIVKP